MEIIQIILIWKSSKADGNLLEKCYKKEIDELVSIDNTTHSLFGVSKASSDLMVQEYGRYLNIKTCCLRGDV